MTTKIAVIIPTLNEELFIESCLQSVFVQTYPQDALDIMIIDGGSRDRTCEIVKHISETHRNVRLIYNPQKIQSVAFNIGVKSSDAPIVIRLDAHATYDQHYIELCVKHLENRRYGNVGGKCFICPQQNTLIAQANAVLNKMRFGIGGAAFRVGNEAKEVDSVPFGAFRREVIDIVGDMNAALARGEDNEYNCRVREAGYQIYFDPHIIATYYARNSLQSSVRQMYTNGVSIGQLLYIHKQSVGLRHLIPFVFISSIVGLLIMAWVSRIFLLLLYCEIILYMAMNILSSVHASIKYGWRNLLVLPYLIILVHISYGYGTLVGILKSIKN